MSEKLIFSILENFPSDYNEFQKSNTGRFKKYFEKAGIKNAKPITMKINPKKPQNNPKKAIQGKTILKYGENNYYIGDFKNNLKHGEGYHLTNGLVFIGRFEEDKKVEGFVMNSKTRKVVYEGEWKFNTYHGKGRLSRRNGQFYKGDFFKGKFQGKGTISWPNGDLYEGDFKNGRREGFGKFTFKNGDVYQGEFFGNVFHGNGTYFWVGGDEFKGRFENGKITGEGHMMYSIGILGSGVWDNDMKGVSFSLSKLSPSPSMIEFPRN